MMLLNSRMTAREGDEGTLQATLSRMTAREMAECAEEMIDIALRILTVDTHCVSSRSIPTVQADRRYPDTQ